MARSSKHRRDRKYGSRPKDPAKRPLRKGLNRDAAKLVRNMRWLGAEYPV